MNNKVNHYIYFFFLLLTTKFNTYCKKTKECTLNVNRKEDERFNTSPHVARQSNHSFHSILLREKHCNHNTSECSRQPSSHQHSCDVMRCPSFLSGHAHAIFVMMSRQYSFQVSRKTKTTHATCANTHTHFKT